MKKIKVLVVDDSALVRHLLTDLLEEAPDIRVTGTAIDPLFAISRIREQRPDVITLDVEMPRMDGLAFLKQLMEVDPIPVVMVSALTPQGSRLALKALELGAVDIVAKPSTTIAEGLELLSRELIAKVRAAAVARLANRHHVAAALRQNRQAGGAPAASGGGEGRSGNKIIAIGASTGGPEAIKAVVAGLPKTTPGVVIVQHMPPLFTRSYAADLNAVAPMEVREAETGDRVEQGRVLIAPGGRHMVLRRSEGVYYTEIHDGPPVQYVRPSVDVLFDTVAECAGSDGIGVILTGMGEDGARGLYRIRSRGGYTIAQDEATSIVFGMPGKAVQLGAAERVVPLDQIARLILDHV